jgi:hypothetical protein
MLSTSLRSFHKKHKAAARSLGQPLVIRQPEGIDDAEGGISHPCVRFGRVAVAESSTPRLIGVHGKPGLRGLSPSHLVS